MQRLRQCALLLALCCLLLGGCIHCRPTGTASAPLEWPARRPCDHLIRYRAYACSYDSAHRIPYWVAYELIDTLTDGPYSRRGLRFTADPHCKLPQAHDYGFARYGWSKGHAAPAADFKWDSLALRQTFYFTNCFPQDERMNNGPWNVLENHVRRLANKHGRLWVVTGPIIGHQRHGSITADSVAVPDALFKALLAQTDGTYHAIAFVMQNDTSKQTLRQCALTVDALEQVTGLDFFHTLHDTDQDQAEAELDTLFWDIP